MLEEGEALVDEAAHPLDGGSFGFHCHNPILSGIAHAGCVDSGTWIGSAGGSHFVVFEGLYRDLRGWKTHGSHVRAGARDQGPGTRRVEGRRDLGT
jgi:hypothetical protein